MVLNQNLKNSFKQLLANYHNDLCGNPPTNEVDFIDKTVQCFDNKNLNYQNQRLTTRSIKIHPTPQVRYYPNGFQNQNLSYEIEIGDILYIFKHRVNGVIETRRAIVVQAKFTKENKRRWGVNIEQFRFLCEWHPFHIVSPVLPGNHHLFPEARSWAMYAFFGPNALKYPVYYSANRIRNHRGGIPAGGSFTYYIKPHYSWDTDTSFFMKLIQGYLGENLLKNINIAQFINQLYVYMQWLPDPPGDPQWNGESIKGKKGLGIIEFTLESENDSEEYQDILLHTKPSDYDVSNARVTVGANSTTRPKNQ